MSTINSMSSGIDVNAIVTSLMDVEQLQLARLSKTRSLYELQLKNYTHFNGLLKAFSDSTSHVKSVFNSHSYKVSSSDTNVLNAVLTGKSISPGSHTIITDTLAQAHQIASSAFTTKDTALNLIGDLTIQTDAKQFTLTINASDTLETLRDNINTSLNNQGVSAAILATNGADGSAEYRLVLTSKETGLANQMQLSGTGLSLLNLNHEITQAQNATFRFDGFDVVRANNTVSDLLDGITFTLNAAHSSATLAITEDRDNKNSSINNAVKAFVDAYNAVIDTVDKNQSSQTLRDNTYSLVKLRLENTMKQAIGNTDINILADIGITIAASQTLLNDDGVEYVSTGKLTVDTQKLATLLESNYNDVAAFFTTANTGFISHLSNVLIDINKEGGNISSREKIIHQQELQLDNRMGREESRLDVVKEHLIKQYSTLNTFVQRYQQMSNFLEQQLASLSNSYKK